MEKWWRRRQPHIRSKRLILIDFIGHIDGSTHRVTHADSPLDIPRLRPDGCPRGYPPISTICEFTTCAIRSRAIRQPAACRSSQSAPYSVTNRPRQLNAISTGPTIRCAKPARESRLGSRLSALGGDGNRVTRRYGQRQTSAPLTIRSVLRAVQKFAVEACGAEDRASHGFGPRPQTRTAR